MDPATALLFRSSYNLGIYLHLTTTPPLRLWSGVGDIPQQLPAVEVAGQTYRGVRMGDLPDFELMLNGGAERGEFTLEGVSDEALREIAGLDPPVLGKTLYIGLAYHDEHWQPTTAIMPVTEAQADFYSMARARVQGSETPKQVLSLSVGFGETGRSRGRRAVYSQVSQTALFTGDDFCKDVPRYHAGYVIAWPRF